MNKHKKSLVQLFLKIDIKIYTQLKALREMIYLFSKTIWTLTISKLKITKFNHNLI